MSTKATPWSVPFLKNLTYACDHTMKGNTQQPAPVHILFTLQRTHSIARRSISLVVPFGFLWRRRWRSCRRSASWVLLLRRCGLFRLLAGAVSAATRCLFGGAISTRLTHLRGCGLAWCGTMHQPSCRGRRRGKRSLGGFREVDHEADHIPCTCCVPHATAQSAVVRQKQATQVGAAQKKGGGGGADTSAP